MPIYSKLALAAGLVGAAQAQSTDHWAVLIAGSSGYGNYRHQADVCHAYQVITQAGIKPENIITLATDDIANSPENPFPGKMFNKPTDAGTEGVDVYAGCKIDYSGDKVTPEIFSKVLTGDASAGGKVLGSTANSKVFLNFVDHGGVGIIGFPRTTMHATELMKDLQTMHDTKMYKELVFYLEACESGSMFQNLPAGIQVYAQSAANAKESSWGTYCPPDDKVNGKSLNSCLGDLYSVNWMEDSDKRLASGETIADQFNFVRNETATKSHVMDFGDDSIKTAMTSTFQGNNNGRAAGLLGMTHKVAADPSTVEYASLPSADAEVASAYARFMATESKQAATELRAAIDDKLLSKERFEAIATKVTGHKATGMRPEKIDMTCHYAAHKAFIGKCGEWTTGAIKYSAVFAELCAETKGESAPIVSAITEVCK